MEYLVFFATCPRGLESTLATELAQLRATSIEVVQGGVIFQGGGKLVIKLIWKVVLLAVFSGGSLNKITVVKRIFIKLRFNCLGIRGFLLN